MILSMNEGVDVKTTHDGHLFHVQVLTWADAQGRPVRREVGRHPGAVLVVPLLDGDRIVMVRNRIRDGKTIAALLMWQRRRRGDR